MLFYTLIFYVLSSYISVLLSLVAFPAGRIFNKFRDTAPLTLIKDHGIFSLVIILLILITLSLDNVWILLGEN